MKYTLLAVIVITLCGTTSASSYTITLDPVVSSSFYCNSADTIFYNPATVLTTLQPFSTVVQSSAIGGTACDLAVDLTNEFFRLSATKLERSPGSPDTRFAESGSAIRFSVDTQVSYEIDGWLNVDDVADDAGGVILRIQLATVNEFGASTIFYESTQISYSTVDQSFVIDGTVGDTTNIEMGSRIGILDPGITYKLAMNMSLYQSGATAGALGIGGVLILFTEITPPLPSGSVTSWVILSGVMTGLGLYRLQRKPTD